MTTALGWVLINRTWARDFGTGDVMVEGSQEEPVRERRKQDGQGSQAWMYTLMESGFSLVSLESSGT